MVPISWNWIVFLQGTSESPKVEHFQGPKPPMTNFVTKTYCEYWEIDMLYKPFGLYAQRVP